MKNIKKLSSVTLSFLFSCSLAFGMDSLKKEDLPFLIEKIDRRQTHDLPQHPIGRMLLTEEAPSNPSNKIDVQGQMNIPKPISIDVNGGMSVSDYNACSTVMGVCFNMVQKSITDAAAKKGVDAEVALKSRKAWVQGFVDFPLPFFDFKDSQSDHYKKDDFSLSADPDVVDQIVNIKGVAGLKDAVAGALKKSGGNVVDYSNQNRDFTYFGVLTIYNPTEIAIRIVDYTMHMAKTEVKTLCGGTEKTNLDSSYITLQFVGDKEMMVKMQKKMGDQAIDYFAEKLLEFIKNFYDDQYDKYNKSLENINFN